MESNKVGYWLQIFANLGLLLGLILVAVQINQNTQLTRADLITRTYEKASQYHLAMMGENPAKALAKAENNPHLLTDEELIAVRASFQFWTHFDTNLQFLVREGLAPKEAAYEAWTKRANRLYGSNKVYAALWKHYEGPITGDRGWVEIVDRDMGTTEHDSFKKMLSAVKADLSSD